MNYGNLGIFEIFLITLNRSSDSFYIDFNISCYIMSKKYNIDNQLKQLFIRQHIVVDPC